MMTLKLIEVHHSTSALTSAGNFYAKRQGIKLKRWGRFSILASYTESRPLAQLGSHFTARHVIKSRTEGQYYTNPSIVSNNDGMVASVRILNNPIQIKSIRGKISYQKKPRSGIELFWLDHFLKESRRETYVDPNNSSFFLADARIFLVEEDYYHVGTYMAPDGRVTPAVLSPLKEIIPLQLPYQRNRKEKNWTPIPQGGECLFLCQPLPPIVSRYSLQDGALLDLTRRDDAAPPNLMAHGGTGPIRVEEGWLVICRERFDVPFAGLVYVQRAILFDEHFEVKWISGPWVIDGLGIEIVNGAAIGRGQLYLSWGRDDREAHIAYLPLAEAMDWFCKLPPHALGMRLHSGIKIQALLNRTRASFHLLGQLINSRRNFERRSS